MLAAAAGRVSGWRKLGSGCVTVFATAHSVTLGEANPPQADRHRCVSACDGFALLRMTGIGKSGHARLRLDLRAD